MQICSREALSRGTSVRAAESQNSVMLAFFAGPRGQERQHAPTGDAVHFRFRFYVISLVIDPPACWLALASACQLKWIYHPLEGAGLLVIMDTGILSRGLRHPI